MKPHATNDVRAKLYDVFVSYKREDDDARAVLVAALQSEGYDVFWDAKLNHDDWKDELRDEINRSAVVVCLWSSKAAASENVKAEAFHAFGIKKLLSAYIEDASVVPDYFKNTNLHAFNEWADGSRREAQIARILATLGRIISGPRRKSRSASAPSIIGVEWGDISGAPVRLVGRDDEMAMLTAAWQSQAPKKVNAVLLHALGGAGKSALLRTFANELLAAGGCGAVRVYGWSAYSQGSGEQKRADADSFISKALADFAFRGKPPGDPVERARELAKLVQRKRVLLLLDGLEPLQDPPTVNNGRFKDKAFAELLRILASQNSGLVILTTRQEVVELTGFGPLVINHGLDQLTEASGAELLVELGVRGRQRELEEAVRTVHGHALSVTLLGTYLSEICGGEIRHRDQFNFADLVLTHAEEEALATDKTIKAAKRAAKIMQAYLGRFEKLAADSASDGLGKTELALLHMVGLFDRPADGGAVEALLKEPIPGLTDELFFDVPKHMVQRPSESLEVEPRELTVCERDRRIRRAKEALRRLRLLSNLNRNDPYELDAHPIVRAFLSSRLEIVAPEAAKIAHEILYRHYQAIAPYEPDTLEDMQPLFHAVGHGVKAGWAQEVFDDIYISRIHRHREFYLLYTLGSFGSDLTTLAHFFDRPWKRPLKDFERETQAWVLGQAAFSLKSLGRLRDAIAPRRASIDLTVELQNWREAANLANSLSQEFLLLGEVVHSIDVALESISHSNKCDDSVIQGYCLSDHTYAEAQMKKTQDNAYDTMQRIQELIGTDLYGFTSYKHAELMLNMEMSPFLYDLGTKQLELSRYHIDFAFDHLLIGRALDILKNPRATISLEAAVAEFRKSGAMNHLPKALLARAAHRRRRAAAGERELVAKIREDLLEVEDIAGHEMLLYVTDVALERARLALEVPGAFASPAIARVEAEAQATRATGLIDKTGYHRRDPDLVELQARLAEGQPR